MNPEAPVLSMCQDLVLAEIGEDMTPDLHLYRLELAPRTFHQMRGEVQRLTHLGRPPQHYASDPLDRNTPDMICGVGVFRNPDMGRGGMRLVKLRKDEP